ncbi:MAG: C40 family peptidase [Oscillatoriales cyanobacterium C42_A2020_001]|nr:C40 family peptidase [Leptolyngbyaceae cyanobacterium C42_A2020_001]
MILAGLKSGQFAVIFQDHLPGKQPDAAPNSGQYRCQTHLNLYDSATLERLATQAAIGRYVQIVSTTSLDAVAIEVRLCEDDYPGWIAAQDLQHLVPAIIPYQAIALSEAEIRAKIPEAIAFTQAAMNQPNEYLWGGTIGPNYDCSGLMQAAFASVGVWLPRDAYQQEGFTQAIAIEQLQPGDLVFFGPAHKATHVGLYLGDRRYIHSSGKDHGHNGIAVDVLSNQGTAISQTYYAQLRGAGRIVAAYQPHQTR